MGERYKGRLVLTMAFPPLATIWAAVAPPIEPRPPVITKAERDAGSLWISDSVVRDKTTRTGSKGWEHGSLLPSRIIFAALMSEFGGGIEKRESLKMWRTSDTKHRGSRSATQRIPACSFMCTTSRDVVRRSTPHPSSDERFGPGMKWRTKMISKAAALVGFPHGDLSG